MWPLYSGHQLFPAHSTGIGRAGEIGGVEVGFVFQELRVARQVRADEVAVLRAPDLECFSPNSNCAISPVLLSASSQSLA